MESILIGITFNIIVYISLELFIYAYLFASKMNENNTKFFSALQERATVFLNLSELCKQNNISTFDYKSFLWLFPFVSIIDVMGILAHFHVLGIKYTLIHRIELRNVELNRRLNSVIKH